MPGNRNWVFTLNSDEAKGEHVAWLAPGIDCPVGDWIAANKKLVYLVCQAERAPSTGKVHLQGYCQFDNPIALAGLKKISKEAHWEVRRGTHAQARDYAKKEETRANGPWELGEPKVCEE